MKLSIFFKIPDIFGDFKRSDEINIFLIKIWNFLKKILDFSTEILGFSKLQIFLAKFWTFSVEILDFIMELLVILIKFETFLVA